MIIKPALILISLFILTSCTNSILPTAKQNDAFSQDKQLLFFTDERNINKEAIYYDALLDIKKEFPEEFESMKIISERKKGRKYKVTQFPTLLVTNNKKIIVQIEGTDLTKDDILNPIAEALSR